MFTPSLSAAQQQLAAFIPNAGAYYAQQRNFDFGPDNRANVSTLSPYIRRRVLTEATVLNQVLTHHSPKDAEKFIQEIFWRTYWKGWLELRPWIWQDYRTSLDRHINEIQTQSGLRQRWVAACTGATGIDSFDSWAKELAETGYLHNHARMWFASIWIFTLELPWQLGADFFLKHLLDGDPASNTLGWRWVAGLHTKGKHYLASEWNINKFSAKKYEHLILNEQAQAKHEDRSYDIQPILFDEINSEHSLFVFHNLECSLHLVEKEMNFNHYALIDFTSLLKKENY